MVPSNNINNLGYNRRVFALRIRLLTFNIAVDFQGFLMYFPDFAYQSKNDSLFFDLLIKFVCINATKNGLISGK